MSSLRFNRSKAKAEGRTRYFTGLPCKHGHISERHVANGRCCECADIYKIKNPEQVKKNRNAARDRDTSKANLKARERRKTDPLYRLHTNMSSRMGLALKTGKQGKSWATYVPYTVFELKEHIERQFLPGMSWENRNEWHIDHIIPVKHFGEMNYGCDKFLACWGLANLRPVWAKDNLKKSSKRVYLL